MGAPMTLYRAVRTKKTCSWCGFKKPRLFAYVADGSGGGQRSLQAKADARESTHQFCDVTCWAAFNGIALEPKPYDNIETVNPTA